MTPAQGRKQRRELMKQIAREHRSTQREQLARLRAAIRDAKKLRSEAIQQARSRCRAERLAARARARELIARGLEELRAAARQERDGARAVCMTDLGKAKQFANKVQRARAELAAERKYRADMKRIERGNRQKMKHHKRASGRERRAESDDEVRASIPPEFVTLWERVKRKIRGSDRMTRTEAFMHYAEEHPREVLEALEDRTEQVIRELEEQERKGRRALRRAVPREVYRAAAGDVPF
jgi:hypothetical protein